ncbi:MAG: hypothetical protein ACLQJR_14670 [Stellaceae bacterium]
MRSLLLGLAGLTLLAAPALAFDNCEQQLKDTKAAYGGSAIAPKSYAKAGDLIKEAEEQCKAGKAAEAIDLLRQARMMIGE